MVSGALRSGACDEGVLNQADVCDFFCAQFIFAGEIYTK